MFYHLLLVGLLFALSHYFTWMSYNLGRTQVKVWHVPHTLFFFFNNYFKIYSDVLKLNICCNVNSIVNIFLDPSLGITRIFWRSWMIHLLTDLCICWVSLSISTSNNILELNRKIKSKTLEKVMKWWSKNITLSLLLQNHLFIYSWAEKKTQKLPKTTMYCYTKQSRPWDQLHKTMILRLSIVSINFGPIFPKAYLILSSNYYDDIQSQS